MTKTVFNERLQVILKHIQHVQENILIVSEYLISVGKFDMARNLIARGQIHDNSKLTNLIEFEELSSASNKLKSDKFLIAIDEHRKTNPHHPTYWHTDPAEGILLMQEIDIAEMVCDWKARSNDFGTDIRAYAKSSLVNTYKLYPQHPTYQMVMEYIDILCPSQFTET